ncbi:MAG TPA: tandem-95 repeat protein, partial [Caldithrix abyssi]|nr:tandem-95 repeat protein [Caldithrix abyssi]
PNDQWNGSETIRFTATDPGGLSDSDTARFTVTAVNDTPSVSDIPGQTALEGESFAQFDLDDYVIDPDDPDSTINWTADGQIELNVSIDPQTHIATVTAPNDQWNGSETIRFTATDPGGLSDSDTARFTVTAVNDTPSVSDIPDQTVQEGESFAQFDLDDYVSDADNSDAEITWTYKGNRQLQVNIDTLSHVATVTPPNSQWNGSETIRFIATDPDQKSDSDTARFTVTAVNQPPVVSDIPDQTIAEGDSFAVIILDQYVQDPDNADEDMVWTYRGNNQLSVTISADRKARILLPSSEWNGSERIWFKAADPGGLADEDSALFTVEAVNDPPRFTSPLPRLSFAEDDSLYQSVTAWYPNVEDADNPDSTLHFQVLDSSFVWAKDLSGQFLFKALSDWFGTDTLRLKVTDGALADTTILKITVSAVNDAPNIVGLPDSLVFLNTDTVILNLAEYEEDVDTPSEKLFWEMSASDTLLLTEFNPDSKQLTLRAPALNGYAHLYLTLRDDSSAQAQDSILLHVKKDPTSISETGGGVPLFFALEQNYPNPFNPSTLINYSIGSTQGSFVSVRLDIYNIMGQKVTTLIDERQAPGRYKALWKADGLASGVYFYRLVAGKFVSVKKMILMR